MRTLRRLVGNERGVALVMALMVLLAMTGLMLAFVSVSALEPQISRNLADANRALYVSESGIEWAYDYLATNFTTWSTYLAGATCSQGAVLGSADSPVPGLTATAGTFTVRVRNDCQAGDDKLTGLPVESTASATTDGNDRVILTSTAAAGSASRTISVVLRRTVVPSFNAALAFPGVQADVNFSGSAFLIDGRDTRLGDAAGVPTGSASPVYGISVSNLYPANETQVENAAANNQQNVISGRDQASTTSPPGTATGSSTIKADAALTSQAVTDFVNALKASADLVIPSSPSAPFSIRDIGATCATNLASPTCWGTPSQPKVVYVQGIVPDLQTQFTALDVAGTSTGTGILIVENGNVDINGTFRWNGPVIVTGTNVGVRYRGGGDQSVYGAVIVNETNTDGPTNLEGDVRGNASLLYSREALDLVANRLGRRLVATYAWQRR